MKRDVNHSYPSSCLIVWGRWWRWKSGMMMQLLVLMKVRSGLVEKFGVADLWSNRADVAGVTGHWDCVCSVGRYCVDGRSSSRYWHSEKSKFGNKSSLGWKKFYLLFCLWWNLGFSTWYWGLNPIGLAT